jgi:hypothetical protein
MIPGQRHRWYMPQIQRDRARTLIREANEILKADRHSRNNYRRDDVIVVSRTEPPPEVPSKWRPLSELRRVIKQRRNGND